MNIINYMCEKCWDKGEVFSLWSFKTKLCPDCNGDPYSMLPPRPDPPPAPPPPQFYQVEERIVYRERNLDKLIESWETYRSNS